MQVVIPWYTEAISSPSDLATHFSASFGTHQFSVIEVRHSYTSHKPISQVMSGEANDAPNFVDGFLIRAAYVLSDNTRHPMLLLITQATTAISHYTIHRCAAAMLPTSLPSLPPRFRSKSLVSRCQ